MEKREIPHVLLVMSPELKELYRQVLDFIFEATGRHPLQRNNRKIYQAMLRLKAVLETLGADIKRYLNAQRDYITALENPYNDNLYYLSSSIAIKLYKKYKISLQRKADFSGALQKISTNIESTEQETILGLNDLEHILIVNPEIPPMLLDLRVHELVHSKCPVLILVHSKECPLCLAKPPIQIIEKFTYKNYRQDMTEMLLTLLRKFPRTKQFLSEHFKNN